jgi:hypothetical protein
VEVEEVEKLHQLLEQVVPVDLVVVELEMEVLLEDLEILQQPHLHKELMEEVEYLTLLVDLILLVEVVVVPVVLVKMVQG